MTTIIADKQQIEQILAKYRNDLGDDFVPYKGHCYRVINYMKCMGMTSQEEHISTVLVPFHDIGIWTHQTMDYLAVSAAVAREYIQREKMDIEDEIIDTFIRDHHKISSSPNGLAEKLRKADLIDLTWGRIRWGIPRGHVRQIKQHFPHQNFQKKVYAKVLRYACSHPLRPFPMLKI